MTDRVGQVRGREGRSDRETGRRDSGREIRALTSLLTDDDERIVGMVWDNLVRLGPRALPYLAEAREAADPRLRIRARYVTQRIQTDQLERQFRQLAVRRSGSFDLEAALCLVAKIEYPDLDCDQIAAELEDLADGLRPQLLPEYSPQEKVARLCRYLFEEVGFEGDRENFYDPDNCYLNQVIARRRGIPLSLAAVTILVGRRLGLPLYGVGLPKNFLVKHQDGVTEIFFDPYNGGRLLTREQCTQILTSEGYYVRPSFVSDYLSIASPRDMVIRLLRHLILTYSRSRDRRRVRRLIRYVDILRMQRPAGSR
ncbi:MAG: transglutaminase family protein [Candidatus Eisenbacteria bacterium]|nr:transglutaminase family protein [Candidatus Eisenbacteria bacterium]